MALNFRCFRGSAVLHENYSTKIVRQKCLLLLSSLCYPATSSHISRPTLELAVKRSTCIIWQLYLLASTITLALAIASEDVYSKLLLELLSATLEYKSSHIPPDSTTHVPSSAITAANDRVDRVLSSASQQDSSKKPLVEEPTRN